MAKYPEHPTKRSAVTRKGNIGAVIVAENVIQQCLHSRVEVRIRLADIGFPEWVGFGKASLEFVGRELLVDVGFAASAIAGMNTDGFAE